MGEYSKGELDRKERDNMWEVKKLCYMYSRLEKEISPTMLKFDHNDYVLRITEESRHNVTVYIRKRSNCKLIHTVKFKKKPGLGVVYSFRNAESFNFLAFEPEKLQDIQVTI